MNIPEPKSVEIKLFGETVLLTERTAEERFQLEEAVASRNGDAGSFDYIISLKAIESALRINIKTLPLWLRPVKRIKTAKWNALFGIKNLRKSLAWSQIQSLLDELGKLEWGDDYESIKKKATGGAVTQSRGKSSGDS